MRGWVRVAAALAALLVLAALVIAWALPRWAAGEDARARLTAAAEEATGRRFAYEAIDVGLLPPRVELRGAALGDPGQEGARAERVSLRIALLPLLARAVVIDALVVEGADVELVRTAHGVELPGEALKREEEREPSPDAGRDRDGGGFSLALRRARLRGARVALRGEAAVGPFDADAALEGDADAPRGDFHLELGAGEIRWAELLEKPAGVAAEVRGRAAREAGAWRVDDLTLRLGPLAARGAIVDDPAPALRLDAPPFAIEELAALLPGLADAAVGGRAALEAFEVRFEPLGLGGIVRLDPAELGDFEGEALALRGALRGEGTSLVSDGMRGALAGQEAPVALRVDDVFGDARARVDTELRGADSGALLGALSGRRDLVSGPLDLTARLEALPTAPEPLLRTLAGSVELRIAPGRLRGVSLLRGAAEAAGPMGDAMLAAGRRSGEDSVRRVYEDEFESLSGRFDVSRGVARTNDLRLVYQAYSADLRGALDLATLALDMTGRLTIEKELDAALSGDEGGGERRVIQLARVTGTLDAPRVEISREAVAMLASLYANERRREKWERKLDERLGEGAGRQVLDLLDQVLEGSGDPEGGGGAPE